MKRLSATAQASHQPFLPAIPMRVENINASTQSLAAFDTAWARFGAKPMSANAKTSSSNF